MRTLSVVVFAAIAGCAMAVIGDLVDEAVDTVLRGQQEAQADPGAFKRGEKLAAVCGAEPNRPMCQKARALLRVVQTNPVAQARLKRAIDFPTAATGTLIILIIIGGLLGG